MQEHQQGKPLAVIGERRVHASARRPERWALAFDVTARSRHELLRLLLR